MKFDGNTKMAIRHTMHCLVGCGIGEVVGMLIAASLGWPRIGRLGIGIVLAFLFGYSLTYRGVRRHADSAVAAIKITAATDTVSITSMEIVDNTVEFLIPNALYVMPSQPRFWWGLALSLSVAFCITVPVNKYMIAKYPGHHHHR